MYIYYDNIEHGITALFDVKIYHGKDPIYDHR